MAAHKPAFKAYDMQGLVSKVNKSMIGPLPSMYSSSFKNLIKSMLRKNPEHRPTASELLKNDHLKPFVVKCRLQSGLILAGTPEQALQNSRLDDEIVELSHKAGLLSTDRESYGLSTKKKARDYGDAKVSPSHERGDVVSNKTGGNAYGWHMSDMDKDNREKPSNSGYVSSAITANKAKTAAWVNDADNYYAAGIRRKYLESSDSDKVGAGLGKIQVKPPQPPTNTKANRGTHSVTTPRTPDTGGLYRLRTESSKMAAHEHTSNYPLTAHSPRIRIQARAMQTDSDDPTTPARHKSSVPTTPSSRRAGLPPPSKPINTPHRSTSPTCSSQQKLAIGSPKNHTPRKANPLIHHVHELDTYQATLDAGRSSAHSRLAVGSSNKQHQTGLGKHQGIMEDLRLGSPRLPRIAESVEKAVQLSGLIGNQSPDVSVNSPRLDLIPKFSISTQDTVGSGGTARTLPAQGRCSEDIPDSMVYEHGRKLNTYMPSQDTINSSNFATFFDTKSELGNKTQDKGAISINERTPAHVRRAYNDVIHVIRHSTFQLTGEQQERESEMDVNELLDVPRLDVESLSVPIRTTIASSEHLSEVGASNHHHHHHTETHSRKSFEVRPFRQRTTALEGLLELSAQLLQQQRLDELAIVLKPFGRAQASPMDTAMWLSKSLKSMLGDSSQYV